MNSSAISEAISNLRAASEALSRNLTDNVSTTEVTPQEKNKKKRSALPSSFLKKRKVDNKGKEKKKVGPRISYVCPRIMPPTQMK